jgi:glycosyltransferase involved in cell wall biosynthesis
MSLKLANSPDLDPQLKDTEPGRKIAYCLLLATSICAPHTAEYIPSKWIKALLEDGDHRFYVSHLNRHFGMSASAFYDRLRAYADRILGTVAQVPAMPKAPVCDLQVIGPYARSLGLNRSLRMVTDALSRTGLTIRHVDYDLRNTSPESSYSGPLGRLGPARVNLIHLNLENLPDFVANSADVFSNAYNIVMPYWELDSLAPVHRLGIALVDEVWAASHFLEQVFRKAHQNVVRVGMACELPADDARFKAEQRSETRRDVLNSYGVSSSSFIFLTAFDALSTFTRKNLIGVISAFRMAFEDHNNACLVIKTRNVSSATSSEMLNFITAACELDKRIHHIDGSLPYLDHLALLAAADCHVSLHRSEGFGFNLIESMLLNVPVIATNYSGNCDFCTLETSWLVDFDMTLVGPNEYPFASFGPSWATPRTSSAAQCMREVFSDGPLRRKRSGAARENVRRNHSLQRLTQTLMERLNAIGLTNGYRTSETSALPLEHPRL